MNLTLKCPSIVQVGACIVNEEKKIVGVGYNGMPNGCSDDILPWSKTADNWLDTKYPYGKRTSASEVYQVMSLN